MDAREMTCCCPCHGPALAAAPDDVRAVPRAALEWVTGDDTGASSKAIWTHMVCGNAGGSVWGASYPLDPADLGRCLRLLQRVPEWNARMHEMASYSPEWRALVAAWPNLAAEMDREVGIDWRKGRTAPQTYASMKTILNAARSAEEK